MSNHNVRDSLTHFVQCSVQVSGVINVAEDFRLRAEGLGAALHILLTEEILHH